MSEHRMYSAEALRVLQKEQIEQAERSEKSANSYFMMGAGELKRRDQARKFAGFYARAADELEQRVGDRAAETVAMTAEPDGLNPHYKQPGLGPDTYDAGYAAGYDASENRPGCRR